MPTDEEFHNPDNETFTLTYDTPDWDPADPMRAKTEDALNHATAYLMSPGDSFVPHKTSVLASVDTSWPMESMEPTSGESMMAHCNVAPVYADQRTTSTGVTASQLAKRWRIPLPRAQQTLRVTTQRGIRTRPDDLGRRLPTNDRMLWYNRINCDMYTDTMKADVVSMRMNKYAQVYTVPGRWTKVYYGMRTKQGRSSLDAG
jgi:hypothetical protein